LFNPSFSQKKIHKKFTSPKLENLKTADYIGQ
jgi:hypothetical protein